MLSIRSIQKRSFFQNSILKSKIGAQPIFININELNFDILKKNEHEVFTEYDDYNPQKTAINAEREIIKLKGKRYNKLGEKNQLILNQVLTLKGKAGEIAMKLPNFMSVNLTRTGDESTSNEDPYKILGENDDGRRLLSLNVDHPDLKIQTSMWGTLRTILKNNIEGVVDGHLGYLRFVGPGCRFILPEDKPGILTIKKGSTYRDRHIPEGLKLVLKSPTFLTIEGVNLQQIHNYANAIHSMYKPDPYKGAGIYVNDTVYLKKAKSGR
ncbi:hypothetical protein QEN19_002574 [Hanseniaspora menglaensis]